MRFHDVTLSELHEQSLSIIWKHEALLVMIMSQQSYFEKPPSMIGMVSTVANYSNRDIDRLYEQYNPNRVKSGDMVLVKLSHASYSARVVGLSLDMKNKKVYADLKLVEQNKRHPIRVDVADCIVSPGPLYPGHHQ